MAKGPFARLKSERLDGKGELHLKVVGEERAASYSVNGFRARLSKMIAAHLTDGSQDLRVRGPDTNDEAAKAIIKGIIREFLKQLRAAVTIPALRDELALFDEEALFKKITEGGHKRVLSVEALCSGKIGLDVTKLIPTR